MTIFDVISTEVATVTPEELKLVERILTPMASGEKPLGVLHDMDARRLFTLSKRYACLMPIAYLEAKLLTDPAAETAKKREAIRLNTLLDVTKSLTWGQIRLEFGDPAFDAGSLGLRDGWMVVLDPTPTNAATAAAKFVADVFGREL